MVIMVIMVQPVLVLFTSGLICTVPAIWCTVTNLFVVNTLVGGLLALELTILARMSALADIKFGHYYCFCCR